MQKIFDEYGRFLLDAAVLISLLIFLFSQVTDGEGHQGVQQIIGAHMQTWNTDYESYEDTATYAAESIIEAPKITYNGAYTMETGTIRITDHIKAASADGTELPLRVTSIKDPHAEEIIDSYQADSKEITFSLPGIYKITVSAVDAGNRKTVCEIKIPVNK